MENIEKIIDEKIERNFQNLIELLNKKLDEQRKKINESMDIISEQNIVITNQAKLIVDITKEIKELKKEHSDSFGHTPIDSKMLDEIVKRLEKVEEKYLKLEEDDELEPDLPAIISVCEERLEELSKERDWSKMSKEKMGTIIYETLDIVRDLIVQSAINKYTNLLLDKSVAALTTISKEELEKAKQSKKHRDMQNQQLYG